MCFPEASLPGLRGQDFAVWPFDQTQQERVLQAVAQWARTYAVATILGMERRTEAGRQIVAVVIDARGQMQGYQTTNQLDPTEEQCYVPGTTRRLFAINGMTCGVVMCHEGWRSPETVRWAAGRGATIVFHPHHTGRDHAGVRLTQWGAANGPYYEKAMMLRSLENTIYFASVNDALRFQASATSLIAPSGQCQAYVPYGQEGILVQAINVEEATRCARHAIRTRALSRMQVGVSLSAWRTISKSAKDKAMSQNKQTVKKYMDAFSKMDHKEILSCLTDDVEWVIPGAFHLAGKEAFDKAIENDAFVGSPTIRVTRMTEEHDVVVAEGTVHSAKRDGGSLNAAFCDVFVMRDAKIKHLTSYLMEVKE